MKIGPRNGTVKQRNVLYETCINTLIKLIRTKKTKKQKLEEVIMNPIICIGNYKVDKKIKELMKVCNVIEINTPTDNQISEIIHKIIILLIIYCLLYFSYIKHDKFY